MRSLEQLEEEAALRHPDPTQPNLDPVCAALCDTGLDRLPGGATSAWLTARDRWADNTIRRQILPGHASVLVLGVGLDPRFSRLPAGLLGRGTVLAVDRDDVLKARRKRLGDTDLSEPAQLTYASVDPSDPEQLDGILHEIGREGHSSWLVMCAGVASWWGLEGLTRVVEALRRDHRPGTLSLGLDWLGPGVDSMPEALQGEFRTRFGAPLAFESLGFELWFKALEATEVETTTLLRYGQEEVGFGTWIRW